MTLVGLFCWEHGQLSFPALKKKKKQVILYSYQSEIFLLSNESFIDQVCWSK